MMTMQYRLIAGEPYINPSVNVYDSGNRKLPDWWESDTYNHVVDNAMECCKELNERLSNLSLGLTKGKEVYNPHISLYAYEYKELPWTHKELNTMMK